MRLGNGRVYCSVCTYIYILEFLELKVGNSIESA